jgi:hypothetical protein
MRDMVKTQNPEKREKNNEDKKYEENLIIGLVWDFSGKGGARRVRMHQ